VDLNRAGVPLLEIVSEPDLHTAEQVRSYAMALRSLLRYLGVNSGDMQKGVIRIEPNVSVRPLGSPELSTRVEIKNLNSFRALERSVAYEIERQIAANRRGEAIIQQTLGWDEAAGVTVPQRSKETADDYRYFPEPDLPPLVVSQDWVAEIRSGLPELPAAKLRRFQLQYGLSAYDAEVLVAEQETANYFEAVLGAAPHTAPKQAANWITGELFSLMNQSGQEISALKITPQALAELLELVSAGAVNPNTAKSVLTEMFDSGESAQAIVQKRGLSQISDQAAIQPLVEAVLAHNPQQVQDYLNGKESLLNWFFGQVMSQASGRANPQVVRQALQARLAAFKTKE
jgi:aspartyl-tRNA(Asn)/glutamyl-tRNA(Gln) amidotransferase subunit B